MIEDKIAHIQKATQDLENIEKQNEASQIAIKEAEKEKERLMEEQKKLKEDSANKSEEEKCKARKRQEELKKEIAEREKKIKEEEEKNIKAKQENEAKEARNKELQGEINEQKTILSSVNDSLKNLTEENKNIKDTIQKNNKNFKKLQEEKAKLEKENKKKIEEAETEKCRIRKKAEDEIYQEKKKLERMENASEEEKNNLKKSITDKENEMKKSLKDQESIIEENQKQFDQEKKKKEENINKLNQEKKDYELKLEETCRKRKEQEEKFRKENEELNKKYEASKEKKSELDKQIIGVQQFLSKKQSELKLSIEREANLTNEKTILERTNKDQENAIKELEEKNKALQEANTNQNNKISTFIVNIREKITKIANPEEDQSTDQDENKYKVSFDNDNVDFTSINELIKNLKTDSENSNSELKERIAKLEQDNKELNDILSENQATFDKYSDPKQFIPKTEHNDALSDLKEKNKNILNGLITIINSSLINNAFYNGYLKNEDEKQKQEKEAMKEIINSNKDIKDKLIELFGTDVDGDILNIDSNKTGSSMNITLLSDKVKLGSLANYMKKKTELQENLEKLKTLLESIKVDNKNTKLEFINMNDDDEDVIKFNSTTNEEQNINLSGFYSTLEKVKQKYSEYSDLTLKTGAAEAKATTSDEENKKLKEALITSGQIFLAFKSRIDVSIKTIVEKLIERIKNENFYNNKKEIQEIIEEESTDEVKSVPQDLQPLYTMITESLKPKVGQNKGGMLIQNTLLNSNNSKNKRKRSIKKYK